MKTIVKLDPNETRSERQYISFLLNEGKTPQQILAIHKVPLVYTRQVQRSLSAEPVAPPEGWVSSIPCTLSSSSDSDSAATAKWMLKQKISPEDVASMIGKRPQWVYQIISGRIHAHVRACDPGEQREVIHKKVFVCEEKDTSEAEAARAKGVLEASYVLWLSIYYAPIKIAEITGFNVAKVRGIVNGLTHKSAKPIRPPEDFEWKLQKELQN